MSALRLLKNRAGVSWLILVAATLVSWAVGAEHGTGSAVGVVVLGIAAIKVRLVGLDFMELRHAPSRCGQRSRATAWACGRCSRRSISGCSGGYPSAAMTWPNASACRSWTMT